MRPYKGYSAEIWHEADDGVFHGYVVGIRDTVHFTAGDAEGLQKEFETSIDIYLEMCAEDGVEPEKPYSGNLALRTTPEIHQMVSAAAAGAGKSINQWVADTIADAARKQIASGATRVRS